jgi:hypothetical protein
LGQPDHGGVVSAARSARRLITHRGLLPVTRINRSPAAPDFVSGRRPKMKKTLGYVLVVAVALVAGPAWATLTPDSDKNPAAIAASSEGLDTATRTSSSMESRDSASSEPGGGSAEPQSGDHRMAYDYSKAQWLDEVWTQGAGD